MKLEGEIIRAIGFILDVWPRERERESARGVEERSGSDQCSEVVLILHVINRDGESNANPHRLSTEFKSG